MRDGSWLCLALASLLLLFPLCGSAQQTGQAQDSVSVRQGFWLNVGVAGSVRSVDCKPLCSRDPGQGAALTLALGGTVSPRLLLGAEIPVWAPWNSPYIDDGHVGLLFTARYYLTQNALLHAGAGFGSLTVVEDDLETWGGTIRAGAAWDWRLFRSGSLTPFVALLLSLAHEPSVSGTEVDGSVDFTYFEIGLGYTWH